MTDKDIIKALECCANGYCENCPFFPTREHCLSIDSLIIDLLNRQQAEIFKLQAKNEALEMDNKQLDCDVFNALMNLEAAQAEIEKLELLNASLTDSCDGYIKAVNIYRAEIERLKENEETVIGNLG